MQRLFSLSYFLSILLECHTVNLSCVWIVHENKLYFIIMMPAAILTSVFGAWLLLLNWTVYLHQGWMLAKLSLVILLWAYHLFCGQLLMQFKHDNNHFSSKFYRFFNEVPTLFLFAIIILVIVKPR